MSLFLLVAPSTEGGGLDLFAGESAIYWTLLIFLISLPLLWKVVYGPVSKALQERESQTREAARAAESAREETARLREAVQQDLDQARREAAERVAQAQARAEAREKEILAEAKAAGEKERRRAQEEIARAKSAAMEELRRLSVDLSVGLAERVISREFGAEDQQRLVAELEKEISEN